jgi:Fe2+ transport system protein FeoA
MNTLETALSLKALKQGQSAVIEHVCASADECSRLAAMGFCCGALVHMLAPGSPCAVQVGETRVMLRGSHTDAIKVTPLG